ncbi:MAG: universal stress protein [Pseudomonadota bacterium]|nr:universal stress protein [Pseudomonadota bacterium]
MNILIATDGSEYASNALDFVLRFPFPHDSKMTVLSVVDDIPMLQAELDALNDAQSEALKEANKQLHEEAEELVEREGGRLREDGWPGQTMVRSGKPVDEILRVAREIDADLIVVGSHGTSLAKRFLLGSVSDRVFEYAPCSVLIVKKKSEDDVTAEIEPGTNAAYRIMLAYDNSDAAHDALDLCSSLPLEENSEIRVVNVLPLITAYRQDIRQHINNIWLQKKQIMQAALKKAVRSLQWATSNVMTELREGENVSDEVLHAAEEAGSDLIMVGCKNKSSIKRFLLGSATHRMARYAKCNVWGVRNKSREN